VRKQNQLKLQLGEKYKVIKTIPPIKPEIKVHSPLLVDPFLATPLTKAPIPLVKFSFIHDCNNTKQEQVTITHKPKSIKTSQILTLHHSRPFINRKHNPEFSTLQQQNKTSKRIH
jgi:hypothetical protein